MRLLVRASIAACLLVVPLGAPAGLDPTDDRHGSGDVAEMEPETLLAFAEALDDVRFEQTAGEVRWLVFREGPGAPGFDDAVAGLSRWDDLAGWPELELVLAQIDAAQSDLARLARARRSLRAGEPELAANELWPVPRTSPARHAMALLRGDALAAVERYRSALESWRDAVRATDDPSRRDRALLRIGDTYDHLGWPRNADVLVAGIGQDSPWWGVSLLHRARYVASADPRRSLGLLTALEQPYPSVITWAPDTASIRARAFDTLCWAGEAALLRAQQRDIAVGLHQTLSGWLDDFAPGQSSLGSALGEGSELPRALRFTMLLEDPDLAGLVRRKRDLDAEAGRLRRTRRGLVRPWRDALASMVETRARRVGEAAEQLLIADVRRHLASLGDVEVAPEVEVSDALRFEGELWADDLEDFRVEVPSRCEREPDVSSK